MHVGKHIRFLLSKGALMMPVQESVEGKSIDALGETDMSWVQQPMYTSDPSVSQSCLSTVSIVSSLSHLIGTQKILNSFLKNTFEMKSFIFRTNKFLIYLLYYLAHVVIQKISISFRAFGYFLAVLLLLGVNLVL